ncbi:TonB-dependent receptor [Sphingobium sp. Sx8-8]|uniref:TonB-dependent receptor n=1 Tax=Sphingobium sp. Sx8-8 TaxID=2933617 RepID=UPI001F588B45|nr:TonB-dependent receptor [Sphingobium sp. Sx8-8]
MKARVARLRLAQHLTTAGLAVATLYSAPSRSQEAPHTKQTATPSSTSQSQGSAGDRQNSLPPDAASAPATGGSLQDGAESGRQGEGSSTGIGDVRPSDIIVTGYRQSLAESANAKKSATNFIDSIYAEDVGKFPDLNLAESLQRLPGVQIDRDRAGEGTTINVRGLSAGFTVTTINGFATTTSAFSGNEGRGSGLDVLPNELFRRLTLSKSPTADMVEGGTAGVVDLQPLRAFDRKGFNISLQAQGQYQDANGSTTPRAAMIVSDTFDTGIGEFGILGALAYAQRNYRSESFDTIGWTTLNVSQVCPRPTTANPSTGCNSNNLLTGGYGGGAGATLRTVPANVPGELGLGPAGSPLVMCLNNAPGGTSGLSCQDLSYALVPRLMRAEQTVGKRSRLGGSFNFEYRPNPDLRFHVDTLFSDVKNRFRQHQLMMVVRSYNNQIPIDFQLNDQKVLTSGTFANTYFLNQSDGGNTPSSLFYRSAGMDWDIGPNLRFSMSGMMNSGRLTNEALQYTMQSAPGRVPLNFSPAGIPQQTLPPVDLTPVATGQYATYTYRPGDLTPSIDSNIDLASFNNYSWNSASISITRQKLEQKAYRFDLVAGDAKDIQFSVGYMRNRFDRRITQYGGGLTAGCFMRGQCGTTFTSTEKSLLEAIPDSQLSNYMVPLPSMSLFKGAPFDAGFNNGWLVPDFDKIADTVDINYFRESINPGTDPTSYLSSFARRDLLEDTHAAYLMVDGTKEIFGRELRFNAGVRYANTFQRANGRVNDIILIGGTGVTIRSFSNKYDSWLPSANFAYMLQRNLVLRGAAARTVTGVNPADLQPNFSLDLDATTFSSGNPKLQPFYADNYDLGIEWYPRSRTVLTFNAWWKNIYNYPFILNTQRPFRELGINFDALTDRQRAAITAGGGPNNYVIQVAQRLNTDLIIKLAGQEFQWVQPTDFLVKGTGFNINVTHIKQKLQGNVPPTLNPNALLAGLAPWTYNATAYYESKAIQLRLSYVHRDENLNRVCPCDNVNGDLYTIATDYLDAQVSFPLPFYDRFIFTIQAQNLLKQVNLTRFDKQEARPYNGQYAGRNFVIGLRANW